MTSNRKIGLELRDGHDAGRDPRRMTGDELMALGHVPMGPLKALRLRCLDCCGGSATEVRLCTAVECPDWPFRLSRNPWRAPASEARVAQGRRLARISHATAPSAFLEKEQIETVGVAGTSLASHIDADKIETGKGDKRGGRP